MKVLEEALDQLIASGPFERLLASSARPLEARVEAGHDFVVSAAARALDAPILAVAAGPHEAETVARGAGAYLGRDRVALLPAWESLPYEGISPPPEIAARRADAARRARQATGRFVLVTPALAAMQGVIPTLGETDALTVSRGAEMAPLRRLALTWDEWRCAHEPGGS